MRKDNEEEDVEVILLRRSKKDINFDWRRFYASQNYRHLITMDSLIKEEDEDDEEMEVFMSFENRISDLPYYKRILTLGI